MAAFRLDAIRKQILDQVLCRLVELDYIEPEEINQVADGSESTVRELVLTDLQIADVNGVRSEDGYFQFATYRFEFGDDWQQWANVRKAFVESTGHEDQFLDAIYATLAIPESN